MFIPIPSTSTYLPTIPSFKNRQAIEKKQNFGSGNEFQDEISQQGRNLTNSVMFLSYVVILKIILDLLMRAKKINKSTDFFQVVKPFESLRDNKKVPKLENCKSINQELKQILEHHLAFAKAGKNLINESGIPQLSNRMLLCGPAGVGKSFFAKIFAKSLDAEYKEILYSDIHAQFTGEHLENFKNIFKETLSEAGHNPQKKYVIVFNELDTLLNPVQKLSDPSHKATYVFFKTDERSIFLNYLEELQEKTPNVTIIGTTNILPRSKGLDQAALSRFQNIIEVPYPNAESIFEALKMSLEYLKDKDNFFAKNNDSLKELAQKMANRKCSFRNLEYIVNEAKNIHLREKIKDKTCEFSIDFLRKGEQNLKFSEGELDFNI